MDSFLAFADYGEFWREARKAFTQEFKPLAISNYYPIQTKATGELLRRLLSSPDRWLHHLNQ